MNGDLFSKPPQYTIDSSSLIDIFGNELMVSMSVTPGLWEKISDLIKQGIIISHIEVLQEIKKDSIRGEKLYNWAHLNKHIFKDYNWESEGMVIKSMSPKYGAFVNAKISPVNADPWLIAQAKCRKIKIISEEKFTNSPDPSRYKIPNVCADPSFSVGCINLLGLIKEQDWKFR